MFKNIKNVLVPAGLISTSGVFYLMSKNIEKKEENHIVNIENNSKNINITKIHYLPIGKRNQILYINGDCSIKPDKIKKIEISIDNGHTWRNTRLYHNNKITGWDLDILAPKCLFNNFTIICKVTDKNDNYEVRSCII